MYTYTCVVSPDTLSKCPRVVGLHIKCSVLPSYRDVLGELRLTDVHQAGEGEDGDQEDVQEQAELPVGLLQCVQEGLQPGKVFEHFVHSEYSQNF